jgi:hypothetical protein
MEIVLLELFVDGGVLPVESDVIQELPLKYCNALRVEL